MHGTRCGRSSSFVAAVGALAASLRGADRLRIPCPPRVGLCGCRPILSAGRWARSTERSVVASYQVSVVGEGGFEPPTSCTQSRCATELRYSPCCGRLSEQVKRSANRQVTAHPVAATAAPARPRIFIGTYLGSPGRVLIVTDLAETREGRCRHGRATDTTNANHATDTTDATAQRRLPARSGCDRSGVPAHGPSPRAFVPTLRGSACRALHPRGCPVN